MTLAQSLAALNHPNIAQVFGDIENFPALALIRAGEPARPRITVALGWDESRKPH